jgi:hypothetical protein
LTLLNNSPGTNQHPDKRPLFYAMSPDVSRDDFLFVADELADAGVEMERFAPTFTWNNPVGKRNVIPFKPGTTYRHNEGIDVGKSVDPEPIQSLLFSKRGQLS